MFLNQKIQNIKYTVKHRKAFRIVEKKLVGKVSLRGWLHDLDKIFLYLFFSKKIASKIHRMYSRHHEQSARTRMDFKQMVIDWECARYTKPDKPLNARETLYRFYPHLEKEILPIINELKL